MMWKILEISLTCTFLLAAGEPDSVAGDDCVHLSGGLWFSTTCTNTMPFFCYGGMVEGEALYLLINSSKTWLDAQLYCKEKYTDLASVRNQTENRKIETLTDGTAVWIGLFRDEWKWSDGSDSSFRHWWKGYPSTASTYNCIAVDCELGANQNKLFNWPCTTLLPFICYSGLTSSAVHVYHHIHERKTWSEAQSYCRDNYTDLVTINSMEEHKTIMNSSNVGFWYWTGGLRGDTMGWHWSLADPGFYGPRQTAYRNWAGESPVVPRETKQVLKLKVTPDDPTVDLNDPAVMEAVLKQMEEKLKQRGVSGDVKLTWKKQPDGTVFQEEKGEKRDKTEL